MAKKESPSTSEPSLSARLLDEMYRQATLAEQAMSLARDALAEGDLAKGQAYAQMSCALSQMATVYGQHLVTEEIGTLSDRITQLAGIVARRGAF
ncbi:hypothetical protein HDA40_001812 [Hamadaea flava]|uniref:Uncharacterized protein n=1 Tax=Hamadaea flava TaxID=1742688 RepID=A0ABV8LP31_9ACTN|nr:hypothetical protein [Hamadaea flava]MCP2323305.1 hypothetical protein [Hamadaea flava]